MKHSAQDMKHVAQDTNPKKHTSRMTDVNSREKRLVTELQPNVYRCHHHQATAALPLLVTTAKTITITKMMEVVALKRRAIIREVAADTKKRTLFARAIIQGVCRHNHLIRQHQRRRNYQAKKITAGSTEKIQRMLILQKPSSIAPVIETKPALAAAAAVVALAEMRRKTKKTRLTRKKM